MLLCIPFHNFWRCCQDTMAHSNPRITIMATNDTSKIANYLNVSLSTRFPFEWGSTVTPHIIFTMCWCVLLDLLAEYPLSGGCLTIPGALNHGPHCRIWIPIMEYGHKRAIHAQVQHESPATLTRNLPRSSLKYITFQKKEKTLHFSLPFG